MSAFAPIRVHSDKPAPGLAPTMKPAPAPDVDEIRGMVDRLIANPEKIQELSDDELAALQKYASPYGNVVGAKKSYVNLSIVNMREAYLRRLLMTGLVGYLYRTLYEYEPEADIERLDRAFKRKMSKAKDMPEEQRKAFEEEHKKELARLRETSRRIAKAFLDRNFNYNPDLHVRSAHKKLSDEQKDTQGQSKAELIRKRTAVAEHAPLITQRVSEAPERTFEYLKNALEATHSATAMAAETLKSAVEVMITPGMDVADKQLILIRKLKELTAAQEDMAKLAAPLKAAESLEMVTVEPSADVYYHLNRYITNHYEELRDTVDALYHERPDIEFTAVYYDHFDSEEEAREHRVAHEAEFKLEVFTLENNGITLMGPFKQNRKAMDYYNKNTEVLKLMHEQQEMDHKLGKDMMEKVVTRKKAKNIAEAGLDAPGLGAYIKANNTVRELGAKKILTPEEQLELKKAIDEKEDLEVPEDAIQTNVFYPEEDDEGNLALGKQKMYTQAEAPLHMEDNSPYMHKYQPRRKAGQRLAQAYEKKTIESRDGRTIEVHELKGSDKSQ